MEIAALTPAMKQYVELKSRYPDCILFFRMGDFYEMFFDDAVTASRILEITLTTRDKNKEGGIPLCGVPYHAASQYIARLVDRGFKVAVCEQMEDPRTAKGLVKRDVVRVVTPGLVLDPESLTAKENNYLAAAVARDGGYGLAFIDISTGEFRVALCTDGDDLHSEVSRLGFRELIVEEGEGDLAFLGGAAADCPGAVRVNRFPAEYFRPQEGERRIRGQIPDPAAASPVLRHPAVLAAAGALLRYCGEMQREDLHHLRPPEDYRQGGHLILDETAQQNLELFATIHDGGRRGSLIGVLDHTETPMGGRRLRWWMQYPLAEPERIRLRLAAVHELRDAPLVRRDLRAALAKMGDLERIGGRIAMAVAHARDLNALKAALDHLPCLRQTLATMTAELLKKIYRDIDEMGDVGELIGRAIADEPPATLRDGGMIREGYDAELDTLVSLSRDGKKGIAALEADERKRTGIASLKVGFNNVFGYYLEVSKANAHLVPHDYIRKQTLVNAERYINQALKDYEHTVLGAEERRRQREYELFVEIRGRIAAEVPRLQKTASALADLDVLCSFAEAAERYDYCCPHVDEEDVVEIKDGRHPVVERMGVEDRFVPNDVLLDCSGNRLLIITGPNMAGKSTYIRQVALIVLMAQMGSFVPASRARIGVADRIFTRIGAADRLSRGQSTFMVEMSEVAHILKHATPRSLIILDEVGRGTSTFDGLSIAWAVAEYIHDDQKLGARTLFATHYHQLTELAATRPGVKNYNIAVREWGDRIIFLRKIMEGGTSRSYGIQVAKIAGVPEDVIVRAGEILKNLEREELDPEGKPKIAASRSRGKAKAPEQLSLFMSDGEALLREIRELDVLTMTPLEALTRLSAWKAKLT